MNQPLTLSKLRLGKVDGKHEYLTPQSERDQLVFDAFLIPDSVDPARMNNREHFFIEGFRGTGKTSLLRWHAEKQRQAGSETRFVLFKSDLNETQRLAISTEVGIDWADIDSGKMEISQDFKAAWTWFILHKIGEVIDANTDLATSDTEPLLRLLGIIDSQFFSKSVGFMPRLEGSKVKFKGNLGFFSAELEGDFRSENDQSGKATLDALAKAAGRRASQLHLARPIFIYFDELEVFYSTEDQYRRDQRMVRDLIFAVAAVNDIFRTAGVPIHVLAAVRSEVVDGMGSLGQEVDRLVHDKGYLLAWHHAKRSLDHPLIRMIGRKINAAELELGETPTEDPIARYFPTQMNGNTIDSVLLDRSFYKPRDIMWRLTLAQKIFPSETAFTQEVLSDTESEYSAKLWDEVRYELSAAYSEDEIDIIESVFSGSPRYFDLADAQSRFDLAASRSNQAVSLVSRRSVADLLSDLYRLGAIGNAFRVGPSAGDIRNRWAFRGDPTLLLDKRMEMHPALSKRLSAVSSRRRGSRGAGR